VRSCILAGSVALSVALGGACVDLFHSTDFETLCDTAPSDPRCGDGDAGDAGSEDALTPPDSRQLDAELDFCSWSSAVARDRALRACAWLGACEGPLGESAFGPCVVRAELAYDCSANPGLRPAGAVQEFWSCLASAASCGDVDRCTFPGGAPPCIEFPAGSFTACAAAKNGATRVKCTSPGGGRPEGVEPCVMLGQTCAKESESVARCSGHLQSAPCTTGGCAGTNAVDCNSSLIPPRDVGIDCDSYGARRCESSDGGPACAPGDAAPTCAVESAAACQGSVVSACVGGKEIRIDCDQLGLPCDGDAAPPAYDVSAACRTEVDAGPCRGADKCVGTRIESCGRGALFSVDCVSVGLGSCTIGPSGSAACAQP